MSRWGYLIDSVFEETRTRLQAHTPSVDDEMVSCPVTTSHDPLQTFHRRVRHGRPSLVSPSRTTSSRSNLSILLFPLVQESVSQRRDLCLRQDKKKGTSISPSRKIVWGWQQEQKNPFSKRVPDPHTTRWSPNHPTHLIPHRKHWKPWVTTTHRHNNIWTGNGSIWRRGVLRSKRIEISRSSGSFHLIVERKTHIPKDCESFISKT